MSAIDRILGEAMTPLIAYDWAMATKGRVPPPYENLIASDPNIAYRYALYVICGPWPMGEPAIASEPITAYYYALDIIHGPWPMGEPAIAKSPTFSLAYAIRVLKSRFFACEETMVGSRHKNEYLKAFPDAESDWIAMGWVGYLD